jgi:hypothetical protein
MNPEISSIVPMTYRMMRPPLSPPGSTDPGRCRQSAVGRGGIGRSLRASASVRGLTATAAIGAVREASGSTSPNP